MTVVQAVGLAKTYPTVPPVHALSRVDLRVDAGERVVVVGRSGSGKSTLLNLLGLLDEPSAGTYRLLGAETASLHARERDALRARDIGFVFQDYHVLGHRTCYENVALKLRVTGLPRAERAALICRTLARVGLSHRTHSLAGLLSGGEKQRLAVARAVVTRPALLLADEPTGNLDAVNAQTVLDLFDDQAESGVAVVVITHDDRIEAWADRALVLVDGCLAPAGRGAVRG